MNLECVDIKQMATAFRKQVACDYAFLKRIISDNGVNSSHRAHLMQMCMEKFAKYHQLKMGNQINKQHNGTDKVIPQLFEERYRADYSDNALKKMIVKVRSFCKQIDLLAPAHYGTDKQNLTNCEYPWEVKDVNGSNPRAFAPCEYPFEIFKEEYMTLTPKILAIIEEKIK